MRLPQTSKSLAVVLSKVRWVSPGELPRNPKPIKSGDRKVSLNALPDVLDLYRARKHFNSQERLVDLQSIVSFKNVALSTITTQFLLRLTPNLDPRIRNAMSDFDWGKKLMILERKGYTLEELKHWAWILSPRDPDKRVVRFLTKPQHKPFFILSHLLSHPPYFVNPDLFWLLLRYCIRWYSGEKGTCEVEDSQPLLDETVEYTVDSSVSENDVDGVAKTSRLESSGIYVNERHDPAETDHPVIDSSPTAAAYGSVVGSSRSEQSCDSVAKALGFKETIEQPGARDISKESGEDVTRPIPSDLGMNPLLFGKLLVKLGRHASRLNPSVLPVIADFAISHITHMSEKRGSEDKVYRMQCQVFNAALQSVSSPAAKMPYDNADHNWEALTTLLAFSSNLKRPLVIDRDSYRAIRQILLLLPKSEVERDTAAALSNAWPPYRHLRDGMEEKASPEEYLSRVVKAGFMMQEAGYAKSKFDLVTDILGGMAPNGSPTVHTRANYPRDIHHEHITWAALIRATRNAQEAWSIFINPPDPDWRPSFEVYWEVIVKIAAKPASPEHYNLPGDGRETFPFDNTNLSEFEKGRLTPPSILSLTAEMFQSGVDVKGRSLAWLIRQAPDEREALGYVNHSSLDPQVKESIRMCITDFTDFPPEDLKRPPTGILQAFIDLLCRLQPNRTQNMAYYITAKSLFRIRHAVRLAEMEWQPTEHTPQTFWESILAALARPNILLSKREPQENDMHVLIMATEVMEKAEVNSKLSLDMMHSFSRVLQKIMCSALPKLLHDRFSIPRNDNNLMAMYNPESTAPEILKRPFSNEDQRSWHNVLTPIFHGQTSTIHQFTGPRLTVPAIVREASLNLKKVWRMMSTIGPALKPTPNLDITASNINSYMRTMAFLGDYEEMLLCLQWIVREWAPVTGQMKLADAERLMRALRTFRAFAEDALGEEAVRPIREEIVDLSYRDKNSSIYWPLDDEVEDYILSDIWGNNQNLRKLLDFVRREP